MGPLTPAPDHFPGHPVLPGIPKGRIHRPRLPLKREREGTGQRGRGGDLGRYLEERAPETRACLSSQRVLIGPSRSPAPVRELTIFASSWISRASFPEPARPRKQDTWGRTPLACWRAQVWSERRLRGREVWPPPLLIGRSSGPPPSNWTVSHALLPQMLPVYVIPAPAALDWMVLREVATLLDGTPPQDSERIILRQDSGPWLDSCSDPVTLTPHMQFWLFSWVRPRLPWLDSVPVLPGFSV